MKKVAIVIAVLLIQNGFSQVTLMDTTNRYDYIIITVPEFVSACEVFAQHKENVKDLKTLIVDTTMILNEFNLHTMLQDNIRDFISYAGTYWKEPQPKYFLLIGSLNAIPNFEENVLEIAYSDFRYSQSIYDNDSLTVEFFIGRVPANNKTEVNNYFNKVIGYESDDNIYSWNNNSLFFTEYDTTSIFQLESRAIEVSENLPVYLNSFLLFESLPGTSLKDSMINYINNIGISSLWIFRLYFDNAIGYTNFFTSDDISLLTNNDMPFVIFNMTSQPFGGNSFTNFNTEFLLSESGAIAGVASVGIVYYTSTLFLFESYASNLYSINTISLGEMMDAQPFGSQKRLMNLWGDPSLKLKYDATVDVKSISSFPTSYSLDQNYPNPFNPSTVINFSIPVSGNVEMKVYNVLGKEIKILTDKFYTTGNHQVEFDGSELSSGVYLYTIKSGEYYQTRKMILIK